MDWTEEDSINLLKYHEIYGNRWKKIADTSERFTEIHEKHKNFLSQKIKSLKKEDKVEERKENNPSKLEITCPECFKILDSKYLLLNGLECSCGISKQKLIKELDKFEWVVYIVQEKGKTIYDRVEYVGHSINFDKRHKDHKDWLTDKYIIRISLILGEDSCIQLFKPEGNVKRSSKYNKIRIKKDGKYVDMDLARIINNEDSDIFKFLKNPGYYVKKYSRDNSDWCYDMREETCKHSVKCSIRKYRNIFYDREPWYPISIEYINEPAKKYYYKKNYDKSVKLDPKNFEEVTLRNEVGEKTRKDYLSMHKNLVLYGLWDLIDCPDLFLKNCSTIYSFSTLNSCCRTVSNYLRCLSVAERIEVFGKKVGKKILKEYSVLMTIIVGYTTWKAEKLTVTPENSNDYSDIVKAIKEFEKKDLTAKEMSHLILMRLYIYVLCLRTDYSTVKIRSYKLTDNHINIDEGVIVFNDLKKVENRIIHTIDDKTLQLVKDYIFLVPKQTYLFETHVKKIEYSGVEFAKLISKVFSLYTGKKMNLQRIRKAVATYKRKDTLFPGESKKIAKEMNHSESMSKQYYNLN